MMSEPLRPAPPHTSGPSGKPTAKRKLDAYADDEASLDPNSSQSRSTKEVTGMKKKARVGGIPKGFQIKQVAATAHVSVGLSQELSQDSDQPSTSRSQPLHLSPPPNRHPSPPPNPDDRPLPVPRQPLWVDPPNAGRNTTEKRTKPPSTTGRSSSKPPSSTAGGYSSSIGTLKGKGKEVIRAATPQEELEKLQELRGQIDMIEGERLNEDQRRNGRGAASKPPSATKSIARAPFASRPKPSSTSAQPSGSKTRVPTYRPVSTSRDSSESLELRRGLHDSTTTVPVPLNDTPMIKKNRDMRSERRKSSMGQASARVTESFGAGILANPHPSVDSPEFYTHISPELPEALRIRQLLVWCSSRAQISKPGPTPSTSEPLPNLKPSQQTVFRELQDELMKMLCLGKVDTSISLSDSDSPTSGRRKQKVKEHPRNVINRAQEAEFIKSEAAANAEEVAWSEMVQSLNNKQVNVLGSLDKRREKRKEAEDDFLARWERSRKGKGKADENMDLDPADEVEPDDEMEARVLSSMWNIPADAFRGTRDARFAESVHLVDEELRLRGKPSLLDHDEGRLAQRLGRLEMLVDDIAAGAHVATTLASSSSSHLTAFAKTLASRFNSRIPSLGSLATLTSPAESSGPTALGMMQPSTSLTPFAEPFAKLSVLSTAKPVNAEVGRSDAAKRAAMDLEKGVAGRKLTAIPATPNSRRTPRKSGGRTGK
ncbi:hypothetical protein FRC04_011799 [Tulasnella sp. 424]|nr:hypothetical protein FRC04_011799 [Tulasnella sp. 424]KAG8978143.1 hypothetical protein FRC05_011259 [Tulasnella sp. 425]